MTPLSLHFPCGGHFWVSAAETPKHLGRSLDECTWPWQSSTSDHPPSPYLPITSDLQHCDHGLAAGLAPLVLGPAAVLAGILSPAVPQPQAAGLRGWRRQELPISEPAEAGLGRSAHHHPQPHVAAHKHCGVLQGPKEDWCPGREPSAGTGPSAAGPHFGPLRRHPRAGGCPGARLLASQAPRFLHGLGELG